MAKFGQLSSPLESQRTVSVVRSGARFSWCSATPTLKMWVPLAAALCRQCLRIEFPVNKRRALASEDARPWHTTSHLSVGGPGGWRRVFEAHQNIEKKLAKLAKFAFFRHFFRFEVGQLRQVDQSGNTKKVEQKLTKGTKEFRMKRSPRAARTVLTARCLDAIFSSLRSLR